MSPDRSRRALSAWRSEPQPGWARIALMPIAVTVIALLIWMALTLADPPTWLPVTALWVSWLVWPVLIAGWAHGFARAYQRTPAPA